MEWLRRRLHLAPQDAPPAPARVPTPPAPGAGGTVLVSESLFVELLSRSPAAAPAPPPPPPPPAGTEDQELRFVLNGEAVVVRAPSREQTLARYLRDTAQLAGTKVSCAEGGCGACTVLLRRTRDEGWLPVNACLRPLCSLHGQEVLTAEGLGGGKLPLHRLQRALAEGNGSQCGFCSPAMVASAVALAEKRAKEGAAVPSAAEVELALTGNICRCTGYQPIVKSFCEAFRSAPGGQCGVGDVEDLCSPASAVPAAAAAVAGCHHARHAARCASSAAAPFATSGWTQAASVEDAVAALKAVEGAEVVCGNTALAGVAKYYAQPVGYPPAPPPLFVDVQAVSEMRGVSLGGDGVLRVGAASSLDELREALVEHRDASSALFGSAAELLLRVATPQVRAVGSIGGSVAFAARNTAFPSDVALMLIAARTTAKVVDVSSGVKLSLPVSQYLAGGGEGVLLVSFEIPIEATGTTVVLDKVAKRSHNAHSLINIALRLEAGSQAPLVAIGGAVSGLVRCAAAEAELTGADLSSEDVLRAFLAALASDLSSAGATEARARLAAGAAYRAYLRALPEAALPPRLALAARPPTRRAATGSVEWHGATDPSEAPLGLPLPKQTAALQTSGRAVYCADEPLPAGGLHGAFVFSTEARADIVAVDASVALARDGVMAFLDADSLDKAGFTNDVGGGEPLFAPGKVAYHGQIVGMVCASSYAAARTAAAVVKVTYANAEAPIMSFDDAEAAGSYFDLSPEESTAAAGDAAAAIAGAAVTVEGVAEVGGQAHFHMETQNATASPSEGGGISLVCCTQGPAFTQETVAKALNRSPACVDVRVRRVGGAYGAKISRNAAISCAAALAAETLGRPCRVELEQRDNMLALGSRRPHRCKYTLGLDVDGTLLGVDLETTMMQGWFPDSSFGTPLDVIGSYDSAYRCANWRFKGRVARTNRPANTYCRAPGYLPAMLLLEVALDHAARSLGVAPEALRARNWYKSGDVSPRGQTMPTCTIDKCWSLLMDKVGGFEACRAAVDGFNATSRFIKRGLTVVPMRYTMAWEGGIHVSLVSIQADGKLLLQHSGTEVGQGINTIAAQVAALELGVDVDDVTVGPTRTGAAACPGTTGTGGSITTEQVGSAVRDACQQLAARLAPYLAAQPTFAAAASAARDDGVDMQARGRFHGGKSTLGPFEYASYGAALLEVELDVLSGTARPLRAECVIDVGMALNPKLVSGQVQGGFMMGLGYVMGSESIDYAASGENLTAGTWEYKPPLAIDAPEVMNVTLLPDAPCATGFLRSKAVGEPPVLFGGAAMLALRDAVAAARHEVGADASNFTFASPAPPEALQAACGATAGDYTLAGQTNASMPNIQLSGPHPLSRERPQHDSTFYKSSPPRLKW